MTRALLSSGIQLEYDTFGSRDDPALLLVMGLGAQMTAWEAGWCELLASHGRFVIRFDNRDVGLSTQIDGAVDVGMLMMTAMTGGALPEVPYTLSDMAADAIDLLDHLEVATAHVVGASMGGMITQTMAIEHPERLISATSIMSTVGDLAYGQPTPDAMNILLAPPVFTRAEIVERAATFAVVASQRYFDPQAARKRAGEAFDRSFTPAGFGRQIAAIFASGDRSAALANVTVPMLVIHGLDDKLITPSGGRRTAELVPGAHLLEVADMGHDLPQQLWPLVVAAIIGHTEAAARNALAPAVPS
jgi:pimeloyl-ACP methyl ester carboxylesterase